MVYVEIDPMTTTTMMNLSFSNSITSEKKYDYFACGSSEK